jgi:hypothetical protein
VTKYRRHISKDDVYQINLMTEDMIKNHLEHHFEADANPDFKVEP